MGNRKLYEEALKIRTLYRTGQITREKAKSMIKDYENYYNSKSIELAKKYNQKASKFSFNNFMR